jgi:hypothetical protein
MSPQRFDPKKSEFSKPLKNLEGTDEISIDAMAKAKKGYESKVREIQLEQSQPREGAFTPKDIFSNQENEVYRSSEENSK